MTWTGRILDDHGVLHGALWQDFATFCAKTSRNGAPWGCELTDSPHAIYYAPDPDPPNVTYCPICYPPIQEGPRK